uniref:Retrovirus-related Pol polyprotein from transposon TNT 1-94 n=1 Tax=Tanacetum cinerariifolium TaxID=118510 RepID=A0A699GRY7_TANCI|nr:hypothetical protein [Tanacetum cinerariifolium]
MIIVDADNCPPMLKKSMYDSWKSRMELYIENMENGRMIIDSVLSGLLVWPTIVQEDGTTRKKNVISSQHAVIPVIDDEETLILEEDVLLTVMNSTTVYGDSVNLKMQSSESCDKCFDLDAELLKNKIHIMNF